MTQYGVLLILDEVMCALGRTGTLFACEQDGISPDIVTIAKGLGAGYQPIGAMLCSDDIYQTIASGTGFFHHGHTYMGHPIACAASLAVVEQLVDDGVLSQCKAMGQYFQQALFAALGDHPHAGDIRGRGLFWGIEIVENRDSKQPFPVDKKVHQRKAAAFAEGLVCYPNGGER